MKYQYTTPYIKDDINNIQIWLSTKLSEKWKRQCKDGLGEIYVEEDPHISLTKVGVTLQQHWINDFTNTLRNKFQRMKISYVHFGEVQMFMNEAKTRVFVGE